MKNCKTDSQELLSFLKIAKREWGFGTKRYWDLTNPYDCLPIGDLTSWLRIISWHLFTVIQERNQWENKPEKIQESFIDLINQGIIWIEGNKLFFKIFHRPMATAKYKEWRKAVFERDNYICQYCEERGSYLHAHHIKPWKDCPTLRFEVSNGETLCEKCHKEKHKKKIKANHAK